MKRVPPYFVIFVKHEHECFRSFFYGLYNILKFFILRFYWLKVNVKRYLTNIYIRLVFQIFELTHLDEYIVFIFLV